MFTFGRVILRVLFWTYDRGTWQYDVLCGLILIFIFFTPKAVFDGSSSRKVLESGKIEQQEKPKTTVSNWGTAHHGKQQLHDVV